ncbi:MAG TPA: nucleotidyltransferase domain-containing protein [Pseudobdellovibrionaceae bacterium]|nr:nucleotidyltransferase domain-containing protein [Pseudobdellovibrionaceae bacterium]
MVRTKTEILRDALLFGQKVSELFDDVEIRLFGSYYRNEAKEGSDIDFAVISPDFSEMNYLLSLKILNRIKNQINVEIEPIAITPEELASPDVGSMASYISKESLLVYKE